MRSPTLPSCAASLCFSTPVTDLTSSGCREKRNASPPIPPPQMLSSPSVYDPKTKSPVHLSASAQIRLGKRMARCILGMDKNYSGPRVTGIEQIPSDTEVGIVRIKTKGVAERWLPADNIVGFGLYTASGDEHPVNHVFNAAPDRTDPRSLIVKTNLPIGNGDILGYGIGMSPSCNAVDKDDMPLCAFEWKL